MTPPQAAADRESITRLVHHFYDDVRADDLLRPTFDAVLGERWATQLQQVASGIARNLYRGYFGHPAGFEGIESELHHACR
ncbi:MAG TPA: hypothetical protein VIM34_00290 [Burkholderiaceae bacterium]